MSDITGGAQGTQTDPFRPRPSRRTVVAGAAWAVPAVVGMNALPAWALSPVPCPDYTYTKVRAASQFLSGTLLGTRLSQAQRPELDRLLAGGTSGPLRPHPAAQRVGR